MKRSNLLFIRSLLESLESRRLLSAGQLDANFGTGGIAEIDQGLAGGNAITVQGDGKIVVSAQKDIQSTVTLPGHTTASVFHQVGQNSTQVRFNADGTLDTSFGTGGISGVTIGGPGGPVTMGVNDSDLDLIGSVHSVAGGKFVLVGSRVITQAGGHENVYRYNADGTLDETFGDHGVTVLSWTPNPAVPNNGSTTSWIGGGPNLVAIQSDGKILIARSSGFGAGSDLQVTRLTADGQLDQSFGDDGVKTVTGAGEPGGIVIQADGKILIASTPYTMQQISGNQQIPRGTSTDLVRLNADGSLDTGFGSGGQVIESLGGDYGFIQQLSLQADGKILLLSQRDTADGNPTSITRYNADGTHDNSFGDQSSTLVQPSTQRMVIDDEGRIVTLGMDSVDNGKRNELFSQRLGTDGTLDAGYGTNGVAAISPAGKSFGAGNIALTADGDLLITATISDPQTYGAGATDSHPNLALIKLQGGDGAEVGVQRSVTGSKPPRSPKRIAMELAAQEVVLVYTNASHRSPKRIAMELAAAAAASHRSPKRIAMELAAEASHRSPKRIAMELASATLTFSTTKIS